MIYPCKTSSEGGSPNRCHCVRCEDQVDKATTAMALLKVKQYPSQNDTPTLIRTVSFVEPNRLSSEFNTWSRPRRNTRSNGTTSSARSQPIPISIDEQRLRHREMQDMRENETHYTNATWRMYRRITKYRSEHPLPDCYFDDIDHTSTTTDDDDTSTGSAGVDNKINRSHFADAIETSSAPPFTTSQKDIEDNDTELCMMFILDFE